MPSTGLFLLPVLPNQPSLSAALISSITRSSASASALPAFHLDHRLLADTSSLLPNSDSSQRKFTSILTLSHTPSKAYIGTTPTASKDLAAGPTCITIPVSSMEAFTQLLTVKMQALWTLRQSLTVEAGSSFSLQDGAWIVRVGDVKQSARGQQAGQLRGMVIEVSHADDEDDEPTSNGAVSKDTEKLIRATLEALVDGLEIKIENSRALFRKTSEVAIVKSDGDASGLCDFSLATLYMDMFRGGRG